MMLAPVQECPSIVMSFPGRHSSAPKRPKLSLQIKTPSAPQTLGKSATALKSDVNPTSPTAFNTLSNAYATAIENASPQILRPTVFEAKPSGGRPAPSRLQTTVNANSTYVHPSQRTQTPGPFSISYPDTPSSAHPDTESHTAIPETAKGTPTFTFTPPQSAGASDNPKMFSFSSQNQNNSSPRTARRRMNSTLAPYTHPKSLHSILRNSPLPPRSSMTPATPNTASRLATRAANRGTKRVGYNDPLTQTITTNKYVKSHIDLLAEDSPHSATAQEFAVLDSLDTTMKYTGDETRDGGQTPGPFEEMRRRMAESGLETPGAKARKRKDKKRKWRWTIGDGEDSDAQVTPTTAVERTPITSIWRGTSPGNVDTAMTEAETPEAAVGGSGEPPATTFHDPEIEALDEYGRRGQSLDILTDSETSEEDMRPGTSHSL